MKIIKKFPQTIYNYEKMILFNDDYDEIIIVKPKIINLKKGN